MTMELIAPQLVAPQLVGSRTVPLALQPATESSESAGRSWPLASLKAAVIAVLLGFAIVAVVVLRPYIGHAINAVSHPQLWWLSAGVAAELMSMAAFAKMQHGMLSSAGVNVPVWKMTAMTYAANAVSVSLPAGSALSTGYTFKRLRSWHASIPLASFVLIASGVLSTVSFAVIALVAGGFAGVQQSPLTAVAGLAALIVIVLTLGRLVRHPERVIYLAQQTLIALNRLLRREPLAGQDRVRHIINELRHIRPSRRDWAAGFSFALINWLADLACLIACCRAVGIDGMSFVVAVIAYVAGMTVSSVSLLPGGFGVVDTAMILTLSHGGLSVVSATAGVLLYRLISVVFIVALGWVIWAVWWIVDHRARELTVREQTVHERVVAVPIAAELPVSGTEVVKVHRSCCVKSSSVPTPEGGGRPSARCRAASSRSPERRPVQLSSRRHVLKRVRHPRRPVSR